MAKNLPVPDTDLYALLGLNPEASHKDIKKAYRQKALTCHPDKNPDNTRAAERFHQLSQALAVLTDASARAAYDRVRRAREAAAKRTQRLDDHRKRVKLDLEARERDAQSRISEEEERRITRNLEEEVRRLRDEGSRQLEEQQRLVREQILREAAGGRSRHGDVIPETLGGPSKEAGGSATRLKLKWKCKKGDAECGGYSHEALLCLLQKYGTVVTLIMSTKKRGRAVVEFADLRAAELAVKNEVGLVENPLKVSWLEGPPPPPKEARPENGPTFEGPGRSERDFESLVMMRMRQAAERQRLIEKMQQEDEQDENT
ncbi:dnaJ homolog subfamily C member 17 [Ambystoma mexicanum]|uniref:dnaJ homolog subfamily C member 17 n=1 Tax=Ambystoma mexicanum TaxID=8296 RepID=UPI0037E985F2